VTAAQLAERLDREGVRAVTITHVETSTGVLAPLEELTGVARERGVHVIVDAVCSLAGVPVDMGRLRIDVVLTGAQKALGVPPGLALLAVAPAALERRRSVGRVGAYYADLLNWEASMEDPQVYFSTHAVNLFYALRKGIEIALDEGLETRFERHRALASAFRAGMESLGFTSLTQAPWLAPTMSVLAYPDGIEDEPFRQALARAGVVAAGCLGDFRGRGVRFGHMGNITEVEILRTLAAVEAALADAGGRFEPGAALAAARNQAAPVAAGR
jgi:aspartate aminotransferase-like enzyme